jgi:hypothetical protein
VFYGVVGSCVQTEVKRVKRAKSEDLTPVGVLEPKGHDRAHALSACVALATIASLAVPWVFRAVTCTQAHRLRLSARKVVLERTACDRVHPWPSSTFHFAYK